jgi:DNA-binding cell septation regulator SpoVG
MAEKKTSRVADRKAKKDAEIVRNHFDEFTVDRVTELESGTVFFDLTIAGIKFFSLTVVNGRNGDFISEASRKGKDGKYYKYYFLNLDDETSEAIIDEVFKQLED